MIATEGCNPGLRGTGGEEELKHSDVRGLDWEDVSHTWSLNSSIGLMVPPATMTLWAHLTISWN